MAVKRSTTGLIGFWLLLHCARALGETVEVRLEPFPPLVREDGTGMVVDQLQDLGRQTGLDFRIEVVAYSRAKYQLRNGQADLIGLVPLGRETQDFYDYALELDWRVEARADLFARDPAMLEGEAWRDEPVGTPWGNADFFAHLTGVPRDRFVESSLGNLVQMLSRGRLPVLLFERAATLITIEQLDGSELYYRNLFIVPAGFAVARTGAGRELKQRLDAALPAAVDSPWLQDYRHYLELPDRGRVPARGEPGLMLCAREQRPPCTNASG